MKKIIFAFAVFLLATECFPQGWIQQNSGVTSSLKKVVFVNSNTGFICGAGGKILKTTNGGTNWTQLSTGISADLYSIAFKDELTLVACGSGGMFVRTSDGGATWLSSSYSTTSALRSVCYSGPYSTFLPFMAAGDNGIVLGTSNAGANWFPYTNPSTQQLNSVYFLNFATGYVFGNTGTVGYTTGGIFAIWSFPNTENIMDSKGIGFKIYLCTSGGKFAKSLNNGSNWSLLPTGTTNQLNGITFSGKKFWTVGNSGTIRFSADSGYTWTPQTVSTSGNLNSVCMTDSIHGWVVGDNGFIAVTTTGGTIGISRISSEIPVVYNLSQNFPNPFNPVTNIEFSLPKNGFVRLDIFDISGRLIESLVNSKLESGHYSVQWNASEFSSGTYFYRITTPDFSATSKMLLLK